MTAKDTRSTPALQALLNSSQKYHDAMDNFKDYGVEVSDVKIVLPQMMKQKDKAVAGLTSGIEGLFKKNKVSLNLKASLLQACLALPNSLHTLSFVSTASSGSCTRHMQMSLCRSHMLRAGAVSRALMKLMWPCLMAATRQ